MLSTEPVTMYTNPARFSGSTNRPMRSASGTEELPAHFSKDLLLAPIGMLGPHTSALDVPRRPIEGSGHGPPLVRCHRRKEAHLLGIRSIVGEPGYPLVLAQGHRPESIARFGAGVGGGGGIRTPGTFRFNGFQDRRLKPLGHSSAHRPVGLPQARLSSLPARLRGPALARTGG